ncbi:MAG: hypothetical protein HZA84_04560 [Thaumarchaeota archaeon]|nr:hypothetical protein [Nitrososphaerota archaeon]
MEPADLLLTVSDLLQANVTLITGIFVLLTISILSKRGGRIVVGLIVFTSIPFVISSVFLIRTISTTPTDAAFQFGIAALLFLVGLAYLVVTIGLIAIFIAKNPDQTS